MAIAEALVDAVGLEDKLAGDISFAHGQLDAADLPLLVAAILPQLRETGKAPHIAFAPRRDPVGQPMLLTDDLTIELVARNILLLEDGVAPVFERGKAFVEATGLATVEPNGDAGQI